MWTDITDKARTGHYLSGLGMEIDIQYDRESSTLNLFLFMAILQNLMHFLRQALQMCSIVFIELLYKTWQKRWFNIEACGPKNI